MTSNIALQIAESVVAEGFDSLDAELSALLADARVAGVSPVLVDVVNDASAPTPVRERALGRIVVGLSRTAPSQPLPGWVTSRIQHNVTGPFAA